MSSLDVKRKRTPLDAERERLRNAGYTDAEISEILIAREIVKPSSEPMGHGAMTGVANNLSAAAGYARSFVPSIVADITMLRNEAATATARTQAAVYLVMKFVVVFVIAYVVLQEFSQFRSMTARAQAEACSARLKLLADSQPAYSTGDTPRDREWKRRNDEFNRDCVGAE
jgi:hypothetical protein